MSKNILAVVGILILIGAGWYYYQQTYVNAPVAEEVPQVHNVDDPNSPGVDEEPVTPGDGKVSDTPTIVYDGTSFSPRGQGSSPSRVRS